VQPQEAAGRLARRLRELRTGWWPGMSVTQREVARALQVSPPLISSWEQETNPVLPPAARLDEYALLFAVLRPDPEGLSVPLVSDLDETERGRRDELAVELHQLRRQASGQEDRTGDLPLGGPWLFSDGRPVTIVCAKLPDTIDRPFADPDDPDYVQLYSYTDLDALLELYGHIRAVNPYSDVSITVDVTVDDYTSHLVLLGGVDWNVVTRQLMSDLNLPVRQVPRVDDGDIGGFEVDEPRRQVFAPTLVEHGRKTVLVEDVAHFFRGRNPYNQKRTVTICNGMFGRGTYAAVRTLTDKKFRDRNAAYLAQRFPVGDTYSVLARVRVVGGQVVTPDWTADGTVRHEWPEPVR